MSLLIRRLDLTMVEGKSRLGAKMAKHVLVLSFFLMALAGCSSFLYYPAKESYTDPTQFRHKPEIVDFRTEDGLLLHGWYFKSTVRPAKGTLLFFHGNAQNITTHFFALYWLLDEGYDYFIFDYRGYGDSEGKPSPEGTLADGRAALKWINAHKDPHTHLVIFAQSLGSAVALRVACDARAEHPNAAEFDFTAVAIDSGFVSYRRAAQGVLSRSWLTWPLQWMAYLVLSDEFAPKDCVSHISPRPILVVHGDADQTIEFRLGEKLFALSDDPKEFWRIEGGHHTDFLFRESFHYRQAFLEWLASGLDSSVARDPK